MAYDIARIVGEVKAIDASVSPKRVLIDAEWVEADTIIISSGVQYRNLGVPGEEKYIGKGISYCALCDGNFFRGQPIAVVGGGNSALEESLYLSKIVSKPPTIVNEIFLRLSYQRLLHITNLDPTRQNSLYVISFLFGAVRVLPHPYQLAGFINGKHFILCQ